MARTPLPHEAQSSKKRTFLSGSLKNPFFAAPRNVKSRRE
jgi:hypothetical protein